MEDNKNAQQIQTIRHSMAHVMAYAVQKLFSHTKIAIGPAIDTGFYYDFQFNTPITDTDLKKIEKEMRKIIGRKLPFTKEVISRGAALELFADEPFKCDIINELPEDAEISVYRCGDFVDLCKGPHVDNTKDLPAKAFQLTKIAGAYWRGDENKPMLTRIYATCWSTPEELAEYLAHLADAERRDHRRLGKQLNFFHLDEENPGQIFWHPDGWSVYLRIQQYVREKLAKEGYVEVKTPFVMPQSLWQRSGHWAKYRENMFITESEKRLFALKPMNCPGHIEIFKQGLRSYRDLPLRLAEFGSCTRNEPSGSLHGIMRVRGFVQDDAHIFCTEAQITEEVSQFCRLVKEMYHDFGFSSEAILVKFSTRPQVRIGSDETWDKAEEALHSACKKADLAYVVAEGEGAFYGPKLEFTLIDALGRQWQCGTIQLDYQLPSKERLDAQYIGEDNQKHTPVILHRAVLGSLERFIGILLEHYAGALPLWLHPTQAVVIPVAPPFAEGATKIAQIFTDHGFRVHADIDSSRMNAKIRKYQGLKIPYQFIIGEKEISTGTVTVRPRTGDGFTLSIDELLALFKAEVLKKSAE